MNRKKLNIIMFSLTFILLCLIIFCLVYMEEIKLRINAGNAPGSDTTLQNWQTESTAAETPTPGFTLGTAPETTAPIVETTQETTEATTEPTTEPATEPTTEPETVPETIPETDPDIGQSAADIAKEQVGKPYQYGGEGPDVFDTSGLLYYCYKQIGISIPRSNNGLASFGYVVDKENIRPGDAVFFWSKEPGQPDWPGIYVGNGKVIAAMNDTKPVVEFNLNSPYYTEHFVCVRRFY